MGKKSKKKGGGGGLRRPSDAEANPKPDTEVEDDSKENDDAADSNSAAAVPAKESDGGNEVAESSTGDGSAATAGDTTEPAGPPADAGPRLPDGLAPNYALLSPEEKSLAQLLVNAGQTHLFDGWAPPGTDDDHKHAFFAQVKRLHDSYPFPGGLAAYLERARGLLAASRAGANPLEGWTPSVPSDGETLTPGTPEYAELEAQGEPELASTAFVLVAGGLGERLGYSGIKVALPTELSTGSTYIQHYLKYFEALEAKYKSPIELAIMVSDDTHDRTISLLESHNYYGFRREQVTIMKQEKVAALADSDARIALEDGAKYAIDCKPHGHGDVHSLLYSTGLAKKWQASGKRWVVFFQDTNALAFVTLPAALGVSKKYELEVNSLAIPRVPKQAVGGIAKLTRTDGRTMIVNVEYNQLEPLLKASVNPEGDVADPATGRSPYPGNINQLIFRLEPYVTTLAKCHGVMAEFVNPKYADGSRTTFKKPTRLECMMQDYPRVLEPTAKVGFTCAPAWACFSPVKNNAADAAKAAASGIPPGSASSGEADQYHVHAEMLKLLGAKIEYAPTKEYLGIAVVPGPKVVLSPSFAVTLSELKRRVPNPSAVEISGKSALIVDGSGVVLESLKLDGALVLEVPEGTEVVVKDVVVRNKGWSYSTVATDEHDEVLRMRGYKLVKDETAHIAAPPNAGKLYLTPDLQLSPLPPAKKEDAVPKKEEAKKGAVVAPSAAAPAPAKPDATNGTPAAAPTTTIAASAPAPPPTSVGVAPAPGPAPVSQQTHVVPPPVTLPQLPPQHQTQPPTHTVEQPDADDEDGADCFTRAFDCFRTRRNSRGSRRER